MSQPTTVSIPVPVGWNANYLGHPGPLPFFPGLAAAGITPVVVPVVRVTVGQFVPVGPSFPVVGALSRLAPVGRFLS